MVRATQSDVVPSLTFRTAWPLAWLALGLAAHAQDAGPAAQQVLHGQHLRRVFSQPIVRVAVADEAVLGFELIHDRELLLLGRAPGRTSLVLWFRDGSVTEWQVAVQRDLSLLRAVLAEIHPAIRVESAPDRDAVVLRGTVPDLSYARAAEEAAGSYLRAGRRGRGADALVGAQPTESDPTDADPQSRAATPEVRVDPSLLPERVVINQLRLEALPPLLEQRLEQALRELVGDGVRVRRVAAGPLPDDSVDTFVLEGWVPTQVDLARALSLAARMLGADQAQDLEVVADEAGGLVGAQGAGGGRNRSGGNQGGQGGIGLGGGGANVFQSQVERNVGRAKVLRAAGGRLLSFLDVEDLPQVRVAIRFYEVNRSRLLNYDLDVSVLDADFPLGSRPGSAAPPFTALSAPDVQNVVGLLAGGVTDQVQVVDDRFAIDAVLQLLESEGIARSLSEPSVTVLSGELASVQVGGEVPVPVAFSPALGGDTVTTPGVFNAVEFRAFGVTLSLRPLVGEDDAITLDVSPQVVFPDPQLTAQLRQTTGSQQNTTAFESRSLQTSARLRDGQALFLGGLVSRTRTRDTTSIPFLNRIPLLDLLLPSRDELDEDTELVVFVTPTLVREASPPSAWTWPSHRELLERLQRRLDPDADEPAPRSPDDEPAQGSDDSPEEGS